MTMKLIILVVKAKKLLLEKYIDARKGRIFIS